MKNQRNTKAQKGNIIIERENRDNNYCRLSTYHLQDNRLTNTEQLIFTKLLILPPNFKINTRNTASYFNISEKTFRESLKTFQKLGYLKLIKQNQNNYTYKLKELSDSMSEFNIFYLKYYTNQQRNYFLKSPTTPSKYKKVIKMYIEKTEEYENYVKDLIKDLDNEKF